MFSKIDKGVFEARFILMELHGGQKLWPSEIRTFFTSLKEAFLAFYGRLVRIKIFGREFWQGLNRNSIVVANHATGVDSIILQIGLKRRLFMLAAKKWFEGRFIRFFMTFFCDMIPVAIKEGPCNVKGIKRALKLLELKQSIGLYPAGRMTREDAVPEISNGAAYLALKSGVPIVAVYVKNLAFGPEIGSSPRMDDAVEGLGSVVHNIFNRRIELYIAPPVFPVTDALDRKSEINRINTEIHERFEELIQQASLN